MRSLFAVAVLAPLLLATGASAHPPAVSGVDVLIDGLPGPEGLAFEKRGTLIVGSGVGEVRRITGDGTVTVLANVGEPLAGVTILRDRTILVASFTGNRVWSIHPVTGAASVFATGIPGANFIVQSRRGPIYVSASNSGEIVDIAGGTPITRASGLAFPNGMAIYHRYLYVAELTAASISRMRINGDGTLGPVEVFATGLPAPDGIAFDRLGNLLVVGADALWLVDRKGTVSTLSTDPLLNWPSNIAFGRRRGFSHQDLFLANFGLPLGSGTEILRVRYNHRGARLIR